MELILHSLIQKYIFIKNKNKNFIPRSYSEQ